MKTPLTQHFSLEEMTFSEAAARRGISNKPADIELGYLEQVAQLLEQARLLAGQPLIVHSGYRAPQVNVLVGGVLTSAHCEGRAADFAPLDGDCAGLARKIAASGLIYDQLILEYGWIHLAIPKSSQKPRMDKLTKAGASMPYVRGIV